MRARAAALRRGFLRRITRRPPDINGRPAPVHASCSVRRDRSGPAKTLHFSRCGGQINEVPDSQVPTKGDPPSTTAVVAAEIASGHSNGFQRAILARRAALGQPWPRLPGLRKFVSIDQHPPLQLKIPDKEEVFPTAPAASAETARRHDGHASQRTVHNNSKILGTDRRPNTKTPYRHDRPTGRPAEPDDPKILGTGRQPQPKTLHRHDRTARQQARPSGEKILGILQRPHANSLHRHVRPARQQDRPSGTKILSSPQTLNFTHHPTVEIADGHERRPTRQIPLGSGKVCGNPHTPIRPQHTTAARGRSRRVGPATLVTIDRFLFCSSASGSHGSPHRR